MMLIIRKPVTEEEIEERRELQSEARRDAQETNRPIGLMSAKTSTTRIRSSGAAYGCLSSDASSARSG
ncbi:hypothetical protein [Sinorhizobium fredii]|uniref:hypothetical protein n=1 Tax=Rhizobium fredii TaxID=380 RepID=UPI0018658E1A|nr:hypothetical protein [Sinorhizobium fredii]